AYIDLAPPAENRADNRLAAQFFGKIGLFKPLLIHQEMQDFMGWRVRDVYMFVLVIFDETSNELKKICELMFFIVAYHIEQCIHE
ncbi:hypothetical protein, partial [Desulforhabdus sp. TSK]|uniref:hypothetical protein n=1 Tax=Desulforhabdus sp. TSK TaxID=2925014 RepID=UPI001FC7C77D